MDPLTGKNVVVYGLAKSGLSAIKLLQREGASITVIDKAPREALGEAQRAVLEASSAALVGEAEAAGVLRSADLVVVSPGVPLALPVLREAAAAGVEIIGEVELAWRHLPPAPLFGITGTNGKSTTTALLGHLWTAAGKRPFVGGNLGEPLSEAVLATGGAWDAYVVELSSFQLEGSSTLRCDAAVILNLTPDHIDRYESHAHYGEAKARIFRNQRPTDAAVVNADDPAVPALAFGSPARRYAFTRRGASPGEWELLASADGASAFTLEGARYELRNRALRGGHNLENAMAAALLARHGGLAARDIQNGLDTYGGLPHRIESVATVRGVEWVNDSKATNVDSTLVALSAFTPQPGSDQGPGVWLILGGKGKGAPYEPLVKASRGVVKAVLTIGSDAPVIERAFANSLPIHSCGTLAAAVQLASGAAVPGDVVLLSPACASYDQFRHFEHRGDTFKALVKGLS